MGILLLFLGGEKRKAAMIDDFSEEDYCRCFNGLLTSLPRLP
jgi:hypothetical protein